MFEFPKLYKIDNFFCQLWKMKKLLLILERKKKIDDTVSNWRLLLWIKCELSRFLKKHFLDFKENLFTTYFPKVNKNIYVLHSYFLRSWLTWSRSRKFLPGNKRIFAEKQQTIDLAFCSNNLCINNSFRQHGSAIKRDSD